MTQPNVTFEQAATSVMEASSQDVIQPDLDSAEVITESLPSISSSVEARIDIHEKQLEAQLAFNKELVDRLERNQRFIEESIKRRDEQLTQVMSGLLEAASSRDKDKVEVHRRRRWWKFGKS